jgi:hypothetical protein
MNIWPFKKKVAGETGEKQKPLVQVWASNDGIFDHSRPPAELFKQGPVAFENHVVFYSVQEMRDKHAELAKRFAGYDAASDEEKAEWGSHEYRTAWASRFAAKPDQEIDETGHELGSLPSACTTMRGVAEYWASKDMFTCPNDPFGPFGCGSSPCGCEGSYRLYKWLEKNIPKFEAAV